MQELGERPLRLIHSEDRQVWRRDWEVDVIREWEERLQGGAGCWE